MKAKEITDEIFVGYPLTRFEESMIKTPMKTKQLTFKRIKKPTDAQLRKKVDELERKINFLISQRPAAGAALDRILYG